MLPVLRSPTLPNYPWLPLPSILPLTTRLTGLTNLSSGGNETALRCRYDSTLIRITRPLTVMIISRTWISNRLHILSLSMQKTIIAVQKWSTSSMCVCARARARACVCVCVCVRDNYRIAFRIYDTFYVFISDQIFIEIFYKWYSTCFPF